MSEKAPDGGDAVLRTSSLKATSELAAKRKTFSSLSVGVDALLGGGLRTGEVIEVYGASNTGKTQLAMQLTVSCASRGYSAVFVDTEGTFRPERMEEIIRARSLRPDLLDRIFQIRAETFLNQVHAISDIDRDRALSASKLIVIDTLTKNLTVEYAGSKWAARRQMILGAYLNKLAVDAFLNDRAVLLTNRVASIGAFGSSYREVDIGGETLRHYVQRVIHLKKRGRATIASVYGDQRSVQSEQPVVITSAGII